MVNVVLASQLMLLREGMKRILGSHADIKVVAEVGDALEILAGEGVAQADVLVVAVDTRAGFDSGWLEKLRGSSPGLRVIVVTRAATLHHVLHILQSGARGLLSPTCTPAQLPAAIRTVCAGRIYLHEDISRLLGADHGQLGKDRSHHALTRREFEIFIQLAAGRRLSGIASELGISIKTASTHKARLMNKMGMDSHAQIIQYAVVNGLFDGLRPDRDGSGTG